MRICANQKVILGAPGCGKTTRLLSTMEEEMARGVRPERIAFVSFTRKAANEAAERACKKFGFESEDLPYFRTLHSVAYRELGIEKKQVMGYSHYKELGDLLGVQFTGKYSVEEGLPAGGTDGDQMLFIDNLWRTRCVPLQEQFNGMDNVPCDWFRMKQFSDTLRQFKLDCNLYDYTDMLWNYASSEVPLNVDVAFVDEAQDLSMLQWAVVHGALGNVKRLYIAGDDDQAIFRWSGADVESFLKLEGEKEVLSQSFRLPRRVHSFSHGLIRQVSHRFEKRFAPRADDGNVLFHNSLEEIDLRNGSWMLLCRNAYMQQAYIDLALTQGVAYTTKAGSSIKPNQANAISTWERLRKGKPQLAGDMKNVYEQMRVGKSLARGGKSKLERELNDRVLTEAQLRDEFGLLTSAAWHDALDAMPDIDREYYRGILRNGERLTAPPRVNISTIHGVKGGEADNVVLMTDMARRSHDEYEKNEDDEHRVFYVGATRARQNLHIIMPQTARFYRVS